MYIDLVVCKHEYEKYYLFQAPSFSNLEAGDIVIVDTSEGEKEVKVIASMTAEKDKKDFYFAVKALKATLPLKKVLRKKTVYYTDFNYEDGNNGTNQD